MKIFSFLEILFVVINFIGFCFAEQDELTEPEPKDKYYETAMSILNYAFDIFDYKLCLLKSFLVYNEGQAAVELGKGFLFGFPKPTDTPLPEFLIANKTSCIFSNSLFQAKKNSNLKKKYDYYLNFDPFDSYEFNMTKAFHYFTAAQKLEAPDAKVYYYFLMIQSLILNFPVSLDFALSTEYDLSSTLFHLLNEAQNEDSDYARIILANRIITCHTRKKTIKSIEYSRVIEDNLEKCYSVNDGLAIGDFIRSPFFNNPCETCNVALELLLPAGSRTISFISEEGGFQEEPKIGPDTEQEENFVDLHKVLTLQQKDKTLNLNPEASVTQTQSTGNVIGDNSDYLTPSNTPSPLNNFYTSIKNYVGGFFYSNETNAEKPDHPEVEFLKQRIEVRDVLSILTLGEYYYFGNINIGIEKNTTKAFELYSMAAEEGNAFAQATLGIFYLNGIGTEIDYEKAFYYSQIGAQLEKVDSLNALGFLYHEGKGTEKNATLAIEMFEKSAELGSEEALSNLGVLYYLGSPPEVEPNATKAIQYFEKAMNLGHPNGALVTASLYEEYSKNLTTNCTSIFHRLMSVLIMGPFSSYLREGYKYYVARDYDRALTNYAFASMLGFNAGHESMKYLLKSKKTGSFSCKFEDERICINFYNYLLYLRNNETSFLGEIADMFLDGKHEVLKKNITTAMNIYKYDINVTNSPSSIFSLANMYENGIGIKKNITEAKQLYNKIISEGLTGNFEYGAFLAACLGKFKMIFFDLWKKLICYLLGDSSQIQLDQVILIFNSC